SESRIRPSRPWITTSPPPAFDTISRARSIASACVSAWSLRRPALGALMSHPPCGLGTTCLSVRATAVHLHPELDIRCPSLRLFQEALIRDRVALRCQPERPCSDVDPVSLPNRAFLLGTQGNPGEIRTPTV